MHRTARLFTKAAVNVAVGILITLLATQFHIHSNDAFLLFNEPSTQSHHYLSTFNVFNTSGPTQYPTLAPTTLTPTTLYPTFDPTTLSPTTLAPTTLAPTRAPTTLAPTLAPTTALPSITPSTMPPTTLTPTTWAPTTLPPTLAPTTLTPTTLAPTFAPTTLAPTTLAPTPAPTLVPTTRSPTTRTPTTLAPTSLPTQSPTTANQAVVEVSSGDQSVVGLSVFGGLAALVVGAMLYRRRKDIAGYISRQRSDETADENFQHEFNRKSGTFSVVNRTVDDGTDSRTVVDDPALLRRQSVQFARTQSQESRATVYHDAVHVEDV